MKQLVFPFVNVDKIKYKQRYFTTPIHDVVVQNLLNWTQEKYINNMSNMWLVGSKKSGKTLICYFLLKKFDLDNYCNLTPSCGDFFLNFIKNDFVNNKDNILPKFLIIDNINELVLHDKACREQLFAMINNCLARNIKILFITDSLEWLVKLQEILPDLFDRLRVVPKIFIKKPCEETMKILLRSISVQRKLQIDEKYIDFILFNIERTYLALDEFILRLDEYLWEKNVSVNYLVIKEVIEKITKNKHVLTS